ncbi:MAG: Ig-like domain-containing protein [Planctomycetes bacterium]|nr:Ig-like domain-containing protein [Planctomycetota bacterium]
MFSRHLARNLGRLLLIALLATAVPACKKHRALPPVLTRATPLFDAAGVAHFPLVLLEFDQSLDSTTIAGNVVIYLTDVLGTPTVPWGGSYTFTYLPGSFQILVNNTTNFAPNTEYAVLIFNGLTSSAGLQIQVGATGGLALRFVVGNSGNTNRPIFAAPVQSVGAGTAGQIVWTWTQAQEGGPPANIAANYDFYMSTASGAEDLLTTPLFFTIALATGDTISGLTTVVTYFFRVICRDNQGNITVTGEFSGVAD